MALYIMLSTLSESGRKVLRERPGWIIPLDEFIANLEGGGRRKRNERKKR